VLALVASSIANAGRASLRCIDGYWVPHHGRLLPVGEEPLVDDAYPPLPAPPGACEDELFEDRDGFESRYVELAFGRDDPALRSEGRLGAESAIEAIKAMGELPTGASEALQQRRRSLLEQVVHEKVDQARQSQHDALQWIERARRSGVDPAVLRAAERSLGLTSAAPEAEVPAATPADPSPPPLLRPIANEPLDDSSRPL